MKADAQFIHDKGRYDHWINGQPDKIIIRRREIQYLAGGGSKGGGGRSPPPREEVKGFTTCSARRLRRYIDNYHCDFVGMVTLTYGKEWPKDGRVVKEHLRAWFERVRRMGYFCKNSLVWWLEFQDRGAPHVHMVITGWMSRRWVAMSWAGITGGDEKACSRVESLRDADGVGSYAAKYASKTDQKNVPVGYTNVGRYWGRRGWVPEGGAVPVSVAAATPGRAREHLRALAGACARERARAGAGRVVRGVRVCEHEGGWSIYGTEREIQGLWQKLVKQNAITNPIERLRGATRRRTSPESIAMPRGRE